MNRQYRKVVLLCVLLVPQTMAWGMSRTNPVDIDIIADDGSVYSQFDTREFQDPGVFRSYLEARRDGRYGIRVRNRTGRRVGLVLTVDGRNILSGEKSELAPTEDMYVLGPYQQAVYRGWRTARDAVHRFYFTDVEDSYAAAWGDRSAMGVIAVAVYEEKAPHRVIKRKQWRQRHAPGAAEDRAPAPARESGKGSGALSRPGTGFGEQSRSPSRRVRFEPRRTTIARVFIKYEWRANLCRRGILDCAEPANRFWPFDEEYDADFVPYPPGYGG